MNSKLKRTLRILITAGPTVEPLDPIRFISNRSTGHMGYELAKQAIKRKHKVTLISGPTEIRPSRDARFLRIETARQLYKRVRQELKKSDVLIMASAVSDFRPASFSRSKLRPKKNIFTLRLIKNPDILKSISNKERKNKVIVGFSLETENLLRNARKKLELKGLDLIIANKADRRNVPFGKGPKTVYLLDKFNRIKRFKRATKARIARAILDTIEELCYTSD